MPRAALACEVNFMASTFFKFCLFKEDQDALRPASTAQQLATCSCTIRSGWEAPPASNAQLLAWPLLRDCSRAPAGAARAERDGSA